MGTISIDAINEWVAIKATKILGSIWCGYAFVLLSAAPLVWSAQKDNILYLSNCLQLVALPILGVGTYLLGRAAEQRAQEDHDAIMAEFVIVKDLHAELRAILAADNIADVPEQQ